MKEIEVLGFFRFVFGMDVFSLVCVVRRVGK